MKNCRFVLFFIFSLFVLPIFSAQSLKRSDIPKVMERLFAYHVEHKEFNTLLVKRALKIYIEQFDPEKVYLLDSEVRPYLTLSDAKANEILNRIHNQDYSDFTNLSAIMQNAVIRAKSMRVFIAREIVGADSIKTKDLSSGYASSEDEIYQRQKMRMARFFNYHKERSVLDTLDRKQRVMALFEKKVQRIENNTLYLNSDDKALSQDRVENLVTLKILKSFAKSLDTHTTFFSPEEAYEMRMSLEKQFEGVGVILSEGVDGVMIAELVKGSPAEQSGQIHVNDLLIEIDGLSLADAAFEDVLEILKKKDRGQIILGFQRNSADNSVIRVPLVKRAIVMKDERIKATYDQFGSGIIGKITLGSFYENSDGVSSEKDIKEAIRRFREQGNLIGLVLDLRENSGGFLSQAVKVAGLFVNNGVIVVSKYGKGEIHFLRNIVSKSYYNGPLVVLTSKMSASASEIVAQALQDYGVALVVGDERTFGKGSIQYQTVTDERADLFFKVTVGRYYTVSGRSTQIQGVAADIVVPSQYAPYKIGEMYLEYPLTADSVDAVYEDPLTDLDERSRRLFQARYLPFVQRVVTFWKKMLPELKSRSQARMSADRNFKSFLDKQSAISAKASNIPVNTVDENFQELSQDLQMIEAVNIVKDMIMLEAEEGKVLEHAASDY